MSYRYSSEIPDAFFTDEIAYAAELGVDPVDWIRPLMNESDLSYKAHNATGDASGIFQAMPQTLRNLGFPGDWHEFVKLDADKQLPWMRKYYAPYKGKLVNATAVYMATFTPAWIPGANNPDFIICARDGSMFGGRPSAVDAHTSQLWYKQNRGLDVDNDGRITVSDLTAAIARADRGPRWEEIMQRMHEAQHSVEEVFGYNDEEASETLPEWSADEAGGSNDTTTDEEKAAFLSVVDTNPTSVQVIAEDATAPISGE